MHYVQELTMIILYVQIALLSPLGSVLVIIEKNFWHFSIYKLISSIILCFNFSTLVNFVLQTRSFKNLHKKNQVMSDQGILEATQLFHASQSICTEKFHTIIFILSIQNALKFHLAGTTCDRNRKERDVE